MAAWVWIAALLCGSQAAVLPPPWADIRRNPCASHPKGWLMLYWPSDGKCYTIYKKGYPCSETQELSPGKWGSRTIAECKCPPGTAQLPQTTTCHKLFQRGPCRPGEYFAPVEETFNKRGERQGMCVRPKQCADETLLYWPPDGRCYFRLSQGPCYSGTVLDLGDDGLANCTCATDGPNFWQQDEGCYAHYTRGPCERGQLFLPGAKCGCEPHLPHFHNGTAACYELDTIGPCEKGHKFSIYEVEPKGSKAACKCKAFHARADDGACYRLYTRGPCEHDEMISRAGRCTKIPCARGRLYVPEKRRCYRPGTPEPCPLGEVVAFDFDARPALDGLSHNGVCSCTSGSCRRREVSYSLDTIGPCEKGHKFSIYEVEPKGSKAACKCKAFHARADDGACYRLYTRGPCEHDEMISRAGRCTKIPCARGRLYVPEKRRCYRPGTPEPCPLGEVVAFDFDARPALDGLSHNGVCSCTSGSCRRREVEACASHPGAASYGGACHILHTQGPCPHASWLVKEPNGKVTCKCRPGRIPPACEEDTRLVIAKS